MCLEEDTLRQMLGGRIEHFAVGVASDLVEDLSSLFVTSQKG